MDSQLDPFREWFFSGPSRHFGHVKKPPGPKGSHTGRKYNRRRKKCEAYRLRGQRELNKARRRTRHIRRHPCDLAAQKC